MPLNCFVLGQNIRDLNFQSAYIPEFSRWLNYLKGFFEYIYVIILTEINSREHSTYLLHGKQFASSTITVQESSENNHGQFRLRKNNSAIVSVYF